MQLQEGNPPTPKALSYQGHAYTLQVATGSVCLAMRNRIAILGLNGGVRAYDDAALGKFERAASRQCALSSRMLRHQESLTRVEDLDYKDDLHLATSPAPVDRWLASAYRALGKFTVSMLLFQSLADRYDYLVADSTFGGETMLAAADELDGMLAELEAMRSGIPAMRNKTVLPHVIDAVQSIIRAKNNYRMAAGVMTTLADVRLKTKELYYPSANESIVEK